MSELALQAHGLTKEYRLGHTLSLRRTIDVALPWLSPTDDVFRALNGVEFEVPRGAFFGIVGTNGSGKSTLTQVISGITVPTSGVITVWGRVLPLLEVGAGFHDELTGRENVALLGSILGVPRADVAAAVNRIVGFAGVERHFDTPLKRYSTGMKARLSFATAIFFPADIYVFDEVLAVVDDDFRDQCTRELQRLNGEGRTIIFMSHDLSLVTGICRTGMWLEKGRVRRLGNMAEVGEAYANSEEHAIAVAAAAAAAR